MQTTAAHLESPAKRKRRDRVIPDQHGAWGFLALPVFLGAAAGGWSWALVPVTAAWFLAFPLSWAISGRLTAPRRAERFNRAVLIWTALAVPVMVAALVAAPWLSWVGLAYLIPFGANLAFARARRERDLANDLVFVSECVVAVPVVGAVGAGVSGWALPLGAMATPAVALMMVVCAVTLIGATLHVKSLIRERRNPKYAAASKVFAVASIPIVAVAALLTGYSMVIALPMLVLAGRALFLHNPNLKPGRLGIIELVCLIAVAGASLMVLS